jgi:hypothetical protein
MEEIKPIMQFSATHNKVILKNIHQYDDELLYFISNLLQLAFPRQKVMSVQSVLNHLTQDQGRTFVMLFRGF